jgi:pyridoxine kinase
MNILSIQSQVVYGHVGHQASTFPLQRLGHNVWPAPTVLFSNHLGWPTYRGEWVNPAAVGELMLGLKDLGVFGQVDAILTGYLGDPDMVRAARETVKSAREANPKLIYACDPVMGDDGKYYVKEELAKAITEGLVTHADILFPNIFELRHLTGVTVNTTKDAIASIRALKRKTGAEIVLGTGVPDETDPAYISALALNDDGIWQATGPRHKMRVTASGTGDCFAALFLGRYLPQHDLPYALGNAVAGMSRICGLTAATNAAELQIVESQDGWSKDEAQLHVKKIA